MSGHPLLDLELEPVVRARQRLAGMPLRVRRQRGAAARLAHPLPQAGRPRRVAVDPRRRHPAHEALAEVLRPSGHQHHRGVGGQLARARAVPSAESADGPHEVAGAAGPQEIGEDAVLVEKLIATFAGEEHPTAGVTDDGQTRRAGRVLRSRDRTLAVVDVLVEADRRRRRHARHRVQLQAGRRRHHLRMLALVTVAIAARCTRWPKSRGRR